MAKPLKASSLQDLKQIQVSLALALAKAAAAEIVRAALALIDVRVLDHIIVAPGRAVSMADRGLL